MKRGVLFTVLVLFTSVAFAQEGINFFKGKWKEALTMAKQENKLIFIDVYTSWCGPCKKMAAEVFPQKKWEMYSMRPLSIIKLMLKKEKELR